MESALSVEFFLLGPRPKGQGSPTRRRASSASREAASTENHSGWGDLGPYRALDRWPRFIMEAQIWMADTVYPCARFVLERALK